MKGLEQAFRWVYGFVGLLQPFSSYGTLTVTFSHSFELQVKPVGRANGSTLKT